MTDQWWQPSNTQRFAELTKSCEVCHNLLPTDTLIAVTGIASQTYTRATPYYICPECAQKVIDALQAKKAQSEK